MVAAKKPAPDVYNLVVERLRAEPAACLAFEDSGNGLRSAIAASVPTIVTVSMFADGQNFDGALTVLDHLGEPGQPCSVIAESRPRGRCVAMADLEGWLAPCRAIEWHRA